MNASEKRRIVVTGLGVVSPIGVGREAFEKSLVEGTGGIRLLDGENRHVAAHGVGAEASDFTDKAVKKDYLKSQRKSIKVMCREVQMGAAAALMALEDSKIDMESLDRSRMGVEFGANLMYYPPKSLADACRACINEEGEFDYKKWGSDGLGSMEPLWMLKYLPNMPACHIGIFIDARGPNNSLTLDEASAGATLTEALNIMERGAADVMVVGGTGTRLHAMKTLHSRLWDELGHDDDNPAASCKPFDKNRNGQVVSESAGCLILESEEHAKARGATIYGAFLGGATSCVSSPDGKPNPGLALTNTFNSALSRAELSPGDLGHINAHGLGTMVTDQAEAEAYRGVLNGSAVPVTSLKGYYGNSGAGTGFLDIVGSLLSLNAGKIPQTLHCANPDESLGINVVHGSNQETTNKVFASFNFTNIGQASGVIMEAS